jgi:aspartyl-tRNA(Asn)/glutamyl-tRNA(Gln) amidotransferase subunit A
MARSVRDVAIVVDAMKGIDANDMTSWDSSKLDLLGACKEDVKGKKVCYVKEICNIDNYPNADDELKAHLENFHKTLELCESLGMEVEAVSIDRRLLDAVYSVYRVIHSAEATSNMSNLTGIIFGPRGEGDNYIEMMKDHRTKGFSPLIKRRFIIGSYVLLSENQDRYFKNAQRVRRLIVDEWKKLYETYDAVLCPVGVGPAKKLDELDKPQDIPTMALDEHLQVGNFGGFPSITIPNGFVSNLPVGINITSNCYKDEIALNIAYALESKMEYKNQIAGGVK